VYVEDLCVAGLGRTRLAKSVHDAAINIKAAGRADFNDRGVQVRPPAMVAPRGEAVIHPDAACPTRSVEGISVL
jgi:putative transposase